MVSLLLLLLLLTGTCREGYKRTGESTKCIQCPDSATNKAMLFAGFVVMIIGSAVLIFMTIKDEESGEKETSDAVKKIILNFCKTRLHLLFFLCVHCPHTLFHFLQISTNVVSCGWPAVAVDA